MLSVIERWTDRADNETFETYLNRVFAWTNRNEPCIWNGWAWTQGAPMDYMEEQEFEQLRNLRKNMETLRDAYAIIAGSQVVSNYEAWQNMVLYAQKCICELVEEWVGYLDPLEVMFSYPEPNSDWYVFSSSSTNCNKVIRIPTQNDNFLSIETREKKN